MKVYELKEYLTETDKEFIKIINEMQEKNEQKKFFLQVWLWTWTFSIYIRLNESCRLYIFPG